MIILPKKTVPVAQPEAPLHDIMLFPYYQTREDVLADLGAKAASVMGPPDPSMRRKHWYDPAYAGAEDDGEPVFYDVVHLHPQTGQPVLGADGRPKLTRLALSKPEAGRLNIGTGAANEFPAATVFMRLQPYPFPVRPLHPDEELAMSSGPMPVVVVRNRVLQAQKPLPDGVFTERDRQVLMAIARKLGVDIQ